MHIENSVLLGLFFVAFICLIAGYFFINDIIWSIVWCDNGGKYNTLKKLKKGKSIVDILTMKYLEECVTDHKKAFRFWRVIKKIYIILELLLLNTYLLLYVFAKDIIYSQIIMIIIVSQSVVCSLVIIFQTDTNRNTKYDRARLDQKHKHGKHRGRY